MLAFFPFFLRTAILNNFQTKQYISIYVLTIRLTRLCHSNSIHRIYAYILESIHLLTHVKPYHQWPMKSNSTTPYDLDVPACLLACQPARRITHKMFNKY